MGLLSALNLPAPASPAASGRAEQPAEVPAQPEPGIRGRDAAAFENARKLRDGMRAELDKGWREALAIAGRLESGLKRSFAAELQAIDKLRQQAGRSDGDPPAQVVHMAKALIGLKRACKVAGHPMAGGDDVAYDDGHGTTIGKPESSGGEATAAPEAGDDIDANRRSGAHWVSRFPTSRSTADLMSPFGGKCDAFIAAIEAAGGSVAISATLRPKQRAHLMHWAWQVAKAGVDPAKVPAEAGVDIEWDHGEAAASTQGAMAMVSGYGLAYKPSLTSRHIQGRAIDMTITGIIGKTMQGKDGSDVAIASAKVLHAVGADYGVVKLVSDPPHWSDDGH